MRAMGKCERADFSFAISHELLDNRIGAGKGPEGMRTSDGRLTCCMLKHEKCT
jgi:hypothetical protein